MLLPTFATAVSLCRQQERHRVSVDVVGAVSESDGKLAIQNCFANCMNCSCSIYITLLLFLGSCLAKLFFALLHKQKKNNKNLCRQAFWLMIKYFSRRHFFLNKGKVHHSTTSIHQLRGQCCPVFANGSCCKHKKKIKGTKHRQKQLSDCFCNSSIFFNKCQLNVRALNFCECNNPVYSKPTTTKWVLTTSKHNTKATLCLSQYNICCTMHTHKRAEPDAKTHRQRPSLQLCMAYAKIQIQMWTHTQIFLHMDKAPILRLRPRPK